MKPWRREEWSGPGPRLSVVRMAPPAMGRMRASLENYWKGKRLILSATDAGRILAAIEGALNGARNRSELEWSAVRLGNGH